LNIEATVSQKEMANLLLRAVTELSLFTARRIGCILSNALRVGRGAATCGQNEK
jgi:hypothetical protein